MSDEETYVIINGRGLCTAFQPYNPMDKIEQLEQENAELKAENEQLQALCGTYKTCYQAKHSDIKCLFVKYKQALQEIRTIAEREYNKKLVEKDCFDCDASFLLIINSITKAEEE